MKLVLTHLSVAGKEDAPMLQVEYAVRVPKALRGLERVHSCGNAMVIDARLETMSRWSLRSTCQGQHLELRQQLSRCKWRLAPNLPAPWDQAPGKQGEIFLVGILWIDVWPVLFPSDWHASCFDDFCIY